MGVIRERIEEAYPAIFDEALIDDLDEEEDDLLEAIHIHDSLSEWIPKVTETRIRYLMSTTTNFFKEFENGE